MLQDTILQEIWSRSAGKYSFYAEKDRKTDKWFDYDNNLWSDDSTIITNWEPMEYMDQFFTPLRFTDTTRNNVTVGTPGVLFADLDPVDPRTLAFKPSVAWETSPGNYQAVWFLNEPIEDYNTWADLNRRMTYFTGADRGGWMGSKVLRVPGTANWKRAVDGVPQYGKYLHFDPTISYKLFHLQHSLPEVKSVKVESGEHPRLRGKNEHLLVPNMPTLSRSTMANYLRPVSKVPDRSRHIIRVIHDLKKDGVDKETAFYMLWARDYNKWRTDRHRPDTLWQEISNIYG
jgi:hypothetical protein